MLWVFTARMMSNWWGCFLNLLVSFLLSCLFVSCSVLASLGPRRCSPVWIYKFGCIPEASVAAVSSPQRLCLFAWTSLNMTPLFSSVTPPCGFLWPEPFPWSYLLPSPVTTAVISLSNQRIVWVSASAHQTPPCPALTTSRMRSI